MLILSHRIRHGRNLHIFSFVISSSFTVSFIAKNLIVKVVNCEVFNNLSILWKLVQCLLIDSNMPISLMMLCEEIELLLNDSAMDPELVTELSTELFALAGIFRPKNDYI